MIFAQLQNTVPHAAAEGTKIAGIRLERHVRKLVDNLIKAFFEEGENLSFIASVLIGGNHIIVRVAVQKGHHLPHNFRALLEVGINETHIFAAGVL